MSYLNDAIIKQILESNSNFNSITYQDNTLEMEGQIIDLNNFSLVEIFSSYSELKEDCQKEAMTAQDLFEIIKLNVTIKSINIPNENNNLLSIFDYQRILESEELSQIDEDALNTFYDFIEELYRYRSYLCEDSLNYLKAYENYITLLILKDNLNPKEETAISKYETLASTKNRSEEINIAHINKLELLERRAKRAGYANSLLIVEIVILATFTLSSFIFLWLFSK